MNVVGKISLGLMAMYATAYTIRSMTIELRYFKPVEFGIWWPMMDVDLLKKVDEFRHRLGVPVQTSKAKGAIGRPGEENQSSQHYPRPYVKAIDLILPPTVSLDRAYEVARQVGFHGIGLYPHWKPSHGIHVDVRDDRSAANPALWSAIKTASGQEYVDINRALS